MKNLPFTGLKKNCRKCEKDIVPISENSIDPNVPDDSRFQIADGQSVYHTNLQFYANQLYKKTHVK